MTHTALLMSAALLVLHVDCIHRQDEQLEWSDRFTLVTGIVEQSRLT